MQCELCGRDCDCRPGNVDGVQMMLCSNCMRHGTGIETRPETSVSARKSILEKIKRPLVKDVYKNMSKELVSGWNDLIKNARKKKGLTREELGFRIGERTVTIAKIENGDLRPSDKIVSKLEKELSITLVEEISSVPSVSTSNGSSRSLTLGDFIKREDK